MPRKSINSGKPISQTSSFDAAWSAVRALVERFQQSHEYYFSDEYKEADVRTDFIDKLFYAIGWVRSDDPYRQEMKIEQSNKASKGRADYAFSLAPNYQRVRFYVEAKRPQVSITTPDNCFQAIRYSWPKGIPITVLTDFNSVHIIDCRFKPNIESATNRVVRSWQFHELGKLERFSSLYWLLSREAVADGSIENFAANELPPEQIAAKQYSLFPGEVRQFDDDFLEKLDDWRERLAASFKRADETLTGQQLTECVQRALDRLVFISFLEDKGIEPDQIVSKFGQGGRSPWRDFIIESRRLDRAYNGIVFKHHTVLDAPQFSPHGRAFGEVCDELTDEHSAYNFDSIPVELLGRIYERFLGKVVQTRQEIVEIVEKDDVRKAGGVHYTPDYVVRYMVDHALLPQVEGRGPKDILRIHVIDTSCGSGSFLIGAYSILLQALLTYYKRQPKEAEKGALEIRNGEVHLSFRLRREILLNCIYGVDIDEQAVEVAQLSLYLKLMEDETTHSAKQQQLEMGGALLPPLSANIVVGNSLVTIEDPDGDMFADRKLHELKSLDFKKTFRRVFRSGGFDVVIGNPPYIKEYTNRNAFEHIRKSPYYMGKMDIWYMFACRGLDWLKPRTGVLSFIATNNWVTNTGARKLREKIAADAQIECLIDFGEFKVFRDAGIQTMIFIARKSEQKETYTFDYRRLVANKPTMGNVQALLEKATQRECLYLTPTVKSDSVIGANLTFSNSAAEALLDKIATCKNFELNGSKEVAQGIVAPQDYLNAKGKAKLGRDFKVGQGVFNLSAEEKASLGLTEVENELVKPFYTTVELHRYFAYRANTQWLIYTDSRFKEPTAIEPYPSIKRHLDRFADVITSSNWPYGLHRSRKETFFVGGRIVSLRKCVVPTFTYLDFPGYVSQTFNIVKTKRLCQPFLVGLLNSRLVRYWLAHRGKVQGHLYQIDKEPLLAIPICAPSQTDQENIAKSVRRIIRSMTLLAEARTDNERERLQRQVCEDEDDVQEAVETIYGLTDTERSLIATWDAAKRFRN